MNSLQQRLLDNEKEACAAQEQLQQTVAAYESKNNELAAQLQEAQGKITTLENLTEEDDAAKEKLEALQTSLDDARNLLRAERENQAVTEGALEEAQGELHENEAPV